MADSPEPTDEDLVRRVRAGDESAARLLFERHLPELRAKAEARLPRSLQGKVGASDVIQEAWLAAFLDLTGFEDRGQGSFAAWLRTILERKVVDEVRSRLGAAKRDARREERLATGAAGRVVAPEQPSPSAEVVAAEDEAALLDAIEALSEEHRTVIRLVEREGLSFIETGARIGRTPDATRMLYGRAVARLAELLDRREPGA